jgi:hypothetical protein
MARFADLGGLTKDSPEQVSKGTLKSCCMKYSITNKSTPVFIII